ncbi:hypothetical protein [Krasilnikovia sp. MM14-A1259]|uniref:hypothetical protein n=1 Tax=Krasilnikovia sp. MM14-A1259 TaxID=3373539 RepID=UPI00380F5CF6
MKVFLLVIVALLLVALIVAWRHGSVAREQQRLDDARADAQRWYERLGGQVMNLHGDDPAARQALADAGERYNAAGGQLQQAKSVRQFELARESALEGLAYVRAARLAMGLDAGPELPPLAAAAGAGRLTSEREVTVEGQHYKAGPQPAPDMPYYYPGGQVQGRPVPAGWYSTPLWKTALGAGAGVLGGMLIFDALFEPGFGDMGYQEGFADGFAAGDLGGNDLSDAGDFGGGDWGGDFGGGDFGGDF